MSQKGVLTIVSGFSGAGKGTLIKELIARYPTEYALSVSATTRRPRQGEMNGREYFFISEEEFEKRIENDEFIEYAKYVDHYYGTPKSYVTSQMSAGRDVILEIEIQGALKVKEKFPDSLLIFVAPPSVDELERRLAERGTEDEEDMRNRLHRAYEEADYMERYDYVLVNDELSACVETLNDIITSYHFSTRVQGSFMEDIREELNRYKDI